MLSTFDGTHVHHSGRLPWSVCMHPTCCRPAPDGSCMYPPHFRVFGHNHDYDLVPTPNDGIDEAHHGFGEPEEPPAIWVNTQSSSNAYATPGIVKIHNFIGGEGQKIQVMRCSGSVMSVILNFHVCPWSNVLCSIRSD